MCELCSFSEVFQPVYDWWNNKGIPKHVLKYFNSKPIQTKCHACNRQLSIEDMHPIGRCTRSMCQSCYNTKVANNPNRDTCMICGEWLPTHQLQLIQNNPREIAYHVCNGDQHRGECFEYLVLRHNAILNSCDYSESNGLQYLNSLNTPSTYNTYSTYNTDNISNTHNARVPCGSIPDYIDAEVINEEYEDVTPRRVKALTSGQKSLGPAVVHSSDGFFENMRNPRIKIER